MQSRNSKSNVIIDWTRHISTFQLNHIICSSPKNEEYFLTSRQRLRETKVIQTEKKSWNVSILIFRLLRWREDAFNVDISLLFSHNPFNAQSCVQIYLFLFHVNRFCEFCESFLLFSLEIFKLWMTSVPGVSAIAMR